MGPADALDELLAARAEAMRRETERAAARQQAPRADVSFAGLDEHAPAPYMLEPQTDDGGDEQRGLPGGREQLGADTAAQALDVDHGDDEDARLLSLIHVK